MILLYHSPLQPVNYHQGEWHDRPSESQHTSLIAVAPHCTHLSLSSQVSEGTERLFIRPEISSPLGSLHGSLETTFVADRPDAG